MSPQDVLPPLVPAVPIIEGSAATTTTTDNISYAIDEKKKTREGYVYEISAPPAAAKAEESIASLFGQWTNCRRCHRLTVAGGAFCALCGIPNPNEARRRRNSASQTRSLSGLSSSGALKATGLRLVITTSRDGSNLFTKQREPGVVASSAVRDVTPEDPTPLCLPPTFASLKALDGETNSLGSTVYGRAGVEGEEESLRNGHDDDEDDDDISEDDCLSELSDESDCSSDSSDSSCESDCFDDEGEDFDDEDIIIELEDTDPAGATASGPRLFTAGHNDTWGDRVLPSFLGDAVVSAASLGQVM
ncbi:hypothetical protein FOL47_004688 [Perkinsus chesapeaki]|uniref:Uncharacterized protein n=1 Tax=Perkinsus chesapeaki TaxID=330153 RepID=A0A7J6M1B1_PERCH|nr:hypothetical protein FOL47_004688 [Perkinsus chesapeaki]